AAGQLHDRLDQLQQLRTLLPGQGLPQQQHESTDVGAQLSLSGLRLHPGQARAPMSTPGVGIPTPALTGAAARWRRLGRRRRTIRKLEHGSAPRAQRPPPRWPATGIPVTPGIVEPPGSVGLAAGGAAVLWCCSGILAPGTALPTTLIVRNIAGW